MLLVFIIIININLLFSFRHKISQLPRKCHVSRLMSLSSRKKHPYTLGIDFGTSGVRVNVIDSKKTVILDERELFQHNSQQSVNLWINSLNLLLSKIPIDISSNILAISLCGTSSSCVLVDKSVLSRDVLMYDYSVCKDDSLGKGTLSMSSIQKVCPKGSPVDSSTSTLAKLMSWHLTSPILYGERLAHQADIVVAYLLHGPEYLSHPFVSDWHNALKLGYDVEVIVLSYSTKSWQ